jgi:transketolase
MNSPAPSAPGITPDEDVLAIGALLGSRPDSAERIGMGRNGRVYRVKRGAEEFAAKFYFGPTADGRNRVDVEFSALRFLRGQGVTCVPEPLKADPARHLALYSYEGGEPVEGSGVTSADVGGLLSFVRELRRCSSVPEAKALPAAAEAYFTASDVIGNIRSRLAVLRAQDAAGPIYDEFRRFLTQAFAPALEDCAARAEAAGLGVLPAPGRILSPSDLGFHNALRRPDGRLLFLDFEYFGWDDPAKTWSDARLHPRMRLDQNRRRELLDGLAEIFSGDPGWTRRVETLYPLFALKWCMILLNEFRPDQIERRRYVDREQQEIGGIQKRQLDAARALLAETVREPLRLSGADRGPAAPLRPPSPPLDARSKGLRLRIIQVLEKAGRGHVGGAFSCMEILRVLFDEVLHYSPQDPKSPARDRFILSKGHSCLALYVMLQEKGYFPEEQLWKFCKFDGQLGGHPEPKVPGVEVSTGSLGHGLPVAIGLAVAAKRRGATHRVFTVLGDGECHEGSVWEAALTAAKHRLDNLIVIVDYNKLATYSTMDKLLPLEPFAAKWEAFGFATREVDGHDVAALRDVFSRVPLEPGRPTAILCHTIKGKGISFAEGNPAWHHKSSLKAPDIDALRRALEALP